MTRLESVFFKSFHLRQPLASQPPISIRGHFFFLMSFYMQQSLGLVPDQLVAG